MTIIDFASPEFSLFFIAALVLAFTPGASITYVVARTAAEGKEAGINSAFGTATGGLVHVVAAALGLSVIISESAFLFSVIRYAGACYLIYLGIRLFLAHQSLRVSENLQPAGKLKLFWQGFTVEALNVKTALFFLAFIPQFVNTEHSVVQQFIIYGVICVVLNGTADLIAVLGARVLLNKLNSARFVSFTSGSVLIGLGLFVAVNDVKR